MNRDGLDPLVGRGFFYDLTPTLSAAPPCAD
jgi:hypothetical protein